MQTPKKFSSFSDQVSWISDEKGIKINDREYAEEMLRQIGYFPLMGGYKHLFRISNTKKYKAGTSFEEIVSLYKFDAELRELFFKYLLQVERQMRSLMSYYFTEMYGAEQKQYLDANNYNNTKRNHATIVKLIATLKRATTTTDYTYINYYRKTYGEIPLWVLANVLTFGNLSKMFRVFPQSLKSKVSKNFEPLNQHQMEQFLSVLTKYRNVCAHGERLFTYRTVDAIADTPLHKKLSLPQSGNQYEKGKQDLFAVVIAFRYLLSGKDFLEFKRKLIKEIDRVVDGQADTALIGQRVVRQQIGRGDVHRHHALRHIALRRPQGRGVRLVGTGDLRIGQQIRSLAHAPQGAAQGGGAAHGVAVGTDVGQYQHLVQRPQEVRRLLYGQAGAHSRSSGSTMSALAGLAGFTWFRRSRMCAPWAMESSMKNCSSGV